MYAFVRKDIPPVQIVVQVSHALAEAARSLIPDDLDHPHFVLCVVGSEAELQKVLSDTRAKGIVCKEWHEADLNDELTAFSTEPVFADQRRFFKKYKLLKMSDLEGGVA